MVIRLWKEEYLRTRLDQCEVQIKSALALTHTLILTLMLTLTLKLTLTIHVSLSV